MELPVLTAFDIPPHVDADVVNKQVWLSVSPKSFATDWEKYAASNRFEHKSIFTAWAEELATATLNYPCDGPCRVTTIVVPRYGYPKTPWNELICIFKNKEDAENFTGWITNSYSCKYNTFEPVCSMIQMTENVQPLRDGAEMKAVKRARKNLADPLGQPQCLDI
jgi:hypothetical protein